MKEEDIFPELNETTEEIVNEEMPKDFKFVREPDCYSPLQVQHMIDTFKLEYNVTGDEKYYEIFSSPENTSNMGCGYTVREYVIIKSNKDIQQYINETYGEVKDIYCQWGSVRFDSYKYNKTTLRLMIDGYKDSRYKTTIHII